ncbi:hypothetical protein AAHB37_04815 [Glutamicibacter halophytocola]|uniref:hypothetical protein n=1 Tax=Glutamicibacter halophytocola TaxID=1933880 RepID=UPI00321A41FF
MIWWRSRSQRGQIRISQDGVGLVRGDEQSRGVHPRGQTRREVRHPGQRDVLVEARRAAAHRGGAVAQDQRRILEGLGVDMGIDESGKDELSMGVDAGGTGSVLGYRLAGLVPGAHRLHDAAGEHHHCVFAQLAGGRVDERAALDDDRSALHRGRTVRRSRSGPGVRPLGRSRGPCRPGPGQPERRLRPERAGVRVLRWAPGRCCGRVRTWLIRLSWSGL